MSRMRQALRAAALASSLAAVVPALPRAARADYLPPQKTSEEPVVGGEENAPPKPGHRKIYMVEVEEEEPKTRKVSVTLDPLSLLYPMYALHLEVAVAPEFSVGAFGAFGSPKVDTSATYTGSDRASTWQVGAKGIYYAQGNMDGGIQVGALAVYTHANLDPGAALGTSGATGLGAGFAAGPLLGWKFVTRGGFTIDSEIGIGIFVAKQKASDDTAPKDDRAALLLANLLVGWTF